MASLSLTQREQEKFAIITDILSGKMTKAQAAVLLGISVFLLARSNG